jgi:ATP-dependent Clp protease ATP-binding subunit ClpA
MGARPMKRVIQEQIKRPLADDLLFGDLAGGGEVEVYAPGERKSADTKKKLYLKVSAKGGEPKALPASAD